MKIYGEEKPSLDYIAHFGVKGMKWGQRKAARRERNAQIKSARQRIATKESEIHAHVRAANKAKTTAERARHDRLATRKANELFNSPDHLTASRMTTGEKWTTGLLLGGGTALAVGANVARNL